jgi:mRNA-degrading endonuclease toxin of MazEF toxin-antitoxin module
MALIQGQLVVALDPFKDAESASRPFLILNTSKHPYSGNQYLATAISTQPREEAVQITNDDIEHGTLDKTSYVNPWAVTTIEAKDIGQQIGVLDHDVVATVLSELSSMIELQQPLTH